jgi:hypothetical protein
LWANFDLPESLDEGYLPDDGDKSLALLDGSSNPDTPILTPFVLLGVNGEKSPVFLVYTFLPFLAGAVLSVVVSPSWPPILLNLENPMFYDTL